MRSTSFLRVSFVALLAILLLSTVTAFAKDGRDFAGFYNVHHTKMQGDRVQLTLNLQVQNNGTADVKGGVVTLRQRTGLDLVGATKPIGLLRLHDHVNLSQRFTISRSEYESWREGVPPQLAIIYRANGKTWERSIQVSPRDF